MVKIVWVFVARPERVAEFEERYGSQGDWAKLFRRGHGYRGTEMWGSVESPGTYLVTDSWDAAEDFTQFKERFGAEYAELDRESEQLTSGEKHLGDYEH